MAGVAIVLRNLFLNWLVLLPVLCAVLIVMKLVALWVFSEWQQDWATKWWAPSLIWLVLPGQCVDVHARQSSEPDPRPGEGRRPNPTSSSGVCFRPASPPSPSRCFWP